MATKRKKKPNTNRLDARGLNSIVKMLDRVGKRLDELVPDLATPTHVARVSADRMAGATVTVEASEFVPVTRPASLAAPVKVATVPPRRKRVKSDKEIRSQIIMYMQQFGNKPQAFLNVVCGYVTQMQDLMKLDHEDIIADRVCEKRHPGSAATGLYCRACHEREMAGQFGALPPEAGGGGHDANLDLLFGDENALPVLKQPGEP